LRGTVVAALSPDKVMIEDVSPGKERDPSNRLVVSSVVRLLFQALGDSLCCQLPDSGSFVCLFISSSLVPFVWCAHSLSIGYPLPPWNGNRSNYSWPSFVVALSATFL